ncbi:MAG TPA: PfkB family carbohydrate kinase [Bryobacteraceae bacterium]|nr:PfkB family carbohydrate kinase [Bryobacteraceae bacterium]
MKTFDVTGVGLNATDTILLAPRFPAYAGKAPFTAEIVSPGGQVATALAACSKLGLRTKYIGTVGSDERGRIQMASLKDAGVDVEDVEVRPDCPNQSAYIIVDQSTGERTILWSRPDCLRLDPAAITPEKIACARMLHIDGHDTAGVEKAARLARERGIPVSVDVDTIYPGFDRVLGSCDYLVASAEFPERWTGERDPFRALQRIQAEYRMRVAAMTLGAHGALALADGRFVYSPAFVVNCADTTGAGDVFHGAFCYAVLAGMPLFDTLEFSNAMAALNCTCIGARGGIATAEEARELMRQAARRPHPDFTAAAQLA